MNCRICLSPAEFAGKTNSYWNTDANVYRCAHCDVQFVFVDSFTPAIYDELYSSGDLGYQHDKSKDNLLLAELIYRDINFAAVADSFSRASGSLDVLEIGCGYGYLVNALNQLGHRAYGIDISDKAIAYAKKIYGDHFATKEIDDVEGSFDTIIGIEVIEHLPDPAGFVKKCAKLLKSKGKLIITTPNKDFYNKNTVWMTNPPPVHLFWLGKAAMETMARGAGFAIEMLPYHKYLEQYDKQNLLINWLRYRNQTQAVMEPAPKQKERSRAKNALRSVALSAPVKGISNFLFSFRPVSRTLAVLMTKIE